MENKRNWALIGLFLLILGVSGCKYNLDDVKPEEHKTGIIQIDSTKFRPVLMYEDKETHDLYIVEKGEIKKIELVKAGDTFMFGFVLTMVFVFIVALMTI